MTHIERAQSDFAEGRRAAQRLFLVAEQDTSASRVAANFLLAWWNAGNLGGFDPTDLWLLDHDNTNDVVRLISLIGQTRIYPDAFVPRERVVTLVKAWRPRVGRGPED
ncbi:hypothetical protein ASD99_08425 [Mesorhizobium sp. Root695]|uniref:DUF7673 family protein n=1 Tax=Mesorhizobium sp. Root695 TaxID=1736589 RepID=UPI000708CA6E|nr:hypothetical protein [Mesorhizobium sp. Root695]KRB16382.1 hypothetical protein ASD99_08425 [Mesorhizobium sp. Root695]